MTPHLTKFFCHLAPRGTCQDLTALVPGRVDVYKSPRKWKHQSREKRCRGISPQRLKGERRGLPTVTFELEAIWNHISDIAPSRRKKASKRTTRGRINFAGDVWNQSQPRGRCHRHEIFDTYSKRETLTQVKRKFLQNLCKISQILAPKWGLLRFKSFLLKSIGVIQQLSLVFSKKGFLELKKVEKGLFFDYVLNFLFRAQERRITENSWIMLKWLALGISITNYKLHSSFFVFYERWKK